MTYLSYCFKDNENYFEYYGIENALCGKIYNTPYNESFSIKRILVIQMK